MLFPDVAPLQWMDARVLAQGRQALQDFFAAEHADACELAESDALSALSKIDGLTVHEDPTVRGNDCPIDGAYDPLTATIRYRRSQSEGRDYFTLLHELGHHLLATNTTWSFDIAPKLDRQRIGTAVEERLVSAFASHTLVPETTASPLFARGVTSRAVAELNRSTSASATACLVRALDEPGHRLVMLTNTVGQPWFTQTTGEPWSPGTRTRQPDIETGVLRALEGDGTHRLTTGEGLLFGTGNRNTTVTFDVTVDGGLVFVIIEPALHDSRLLDHDQQWHLDCLAGCGHSFTPNESPGTCATCQQHKCGRCSGCECKQDRPCSTCMMSLPVTRRRAGHTLCEDCE